MCGITGFFSPAFKKDDDKLTEVAGNMARTLKHRGPDDGGVWTDQDNGISFAHCRLSIIDLSPEGHQPMLSAGGRYVTVFNGEIYNFRKLRKELEAKGHSFRGHSDTEVMLAAFMQWGVKEALEHLNGMFAFALWDRQERTLYLGRDRMGEKPLYYGWSGKSFMFGSELKALRRHPEFRAEIDINAVALYLRHNYIPAPHSIYKGFFKLPPASLLAAKPAQLLEGKAEVAAYWSVHETAVRGMANRFTGSEEEAITELETRLREAIKMRLESDVPLGAFLSGGIDSSVVTAVMQSISRLPIKTFTIGFREDAYNEANHAAAVAGHLGTDHTSMWVTPDEAMAVIPQLPKLYDEPFSDSSQIPTYLVSAMTRRHVKVCLSGDGGDELFGGYNRYFWARSLWKKVGILPRPFRLLASGAVKTLSPSVWDTLLKPLTPLLPSEARYSNAGDRVHKLADIFTASSPEDMYRLLVSHWKNPALIVPGASEPPTILTETKNRPKFGDFTESMMYLDMMSYLPDDILVKVDRASMGVGLEARVPFLDHHLVSFAWRLPLKMKVSGSEGKLLLKKLLSRYVPKSLTDRPKMGFGIPLDAWLRGPLRPWAESLLEEARLKREGFFNPAPIRRAWQDHLSGRRNLQYHLWDILMFGAWLEETKEKK